MKDFDSAKKEHLSESFKDLKLNGTEINTVIFEDCTFTECDFGEARFNKCKFIDCRFIKCNLSVVKLSYSRFTDVIFEGCKAIGIDWTVVAWPSIALCSPVTFYRCIMNDSTFFGLSLKELVIEECKAHDTDFREGNFCEANFTYTDFSNSLFNKTNLTGADFTEAVNYQINIHYNQIKSAKFSRHEAVSLLDSLDIELVD